MLVASMMFATMNALIKLAAPVHSLGEIVFFRGLPSVLGIATWMLLTQRSPRTERLTLHLKRNAVGMLAMWMGFYATSHLPLATAVTLVYTSPLFIATYLLTKQSGQLRMGEWMSVGMGFIGVLLVLKPTLSSDQIGYATLGLAAGFFSAAAYLQVKSLGRAGEPEWRTVMYFSVFSTFTGTVGLGLEHGNLQWATNLVNQPKETALMMGIGLFGALGQLAMTRSFGKGSTWLSAALQYSTILFSAGWGFVIWDSIPTESALMGIAIIIGCGVLSSLTAAKQSKNEST